jgi:hypothetical protein
MAATNKAAVSSNKKEERQSRLVQDHDGSLAMEIMTLLPDNILSLDKHISLSLSL